MVPGAEEQSTTFKVQVDRQKPVITSGYIRFKDGAQQFVARKAKDVGDGGILSQRKTRYVLLLIREQWSKLVMIRMGRALENYHVIRPMQMVVSIFLKISIRRISITT